jgi:small-conductance mechanosensitive channel
LKNQIAEFFLDLGSPLLLWESLVLILALSLGLIAGHYARRHARAMPLAAAGGVKGLYRTVFPLVALLLVVLGGALLRHWFPGKLPLLALAVPLLASLALVRLVLHILARVFAPSPWVAAFGRLTSGIIWMILALHITGLLPEITQAMDDFAFRVGHQRVSLLLVLESVFIVAAGLVLALWLGNLAETRIMKTEKLDLSLRVLLTKLTRALLLLGGVLFALSLAGIDLTVVSVFGGALGVGLGFGLQKIASNYVSGFIILMDRSIRLGDLVTVDNRYGSVSAITARYVVVKGSDGTEAIIPNETLITSTVLNHSYTSHQVRVAIALQVAYDTVLEDAMRLMETTANAHPRVLREPPPRAYLKSFGDNGIDLELGVWIEDPEEGQLNLRSDLNLAIWHAFQQAGIEIPYPQRDVRLIGPLPEEVAIVGEQRYPAEEGE